MAASVFDSPLYAQLFPTGEAGRLFSDTAALRAMLLVEGALAKVQGAQGIIPEISAAAIHRATLEIQIDPGALAGAAGENGVPVPGLLAAFRAEMNAPEHAQYVHWGATSQDIVDTGLMLRLRQALALAEADLREIITTLGQQAEAHATLPMPGRTFGQHATPTSWGGVLAEWGAPLIDALEALSALRQSAIWVSLSGAAGTSSALGPEAAQTRADLAKSLALTDPKRGWHTDRTPLLRIIDWQAQVMATLAHMGQSLIGLRMSGINEISTGAAGASSTMPQKQNPIGPSALVALNTQFGGLRSTMQTAAVHQHQRDGTAWLVEWMTVPQLALSVAAALQKAKALTTGLIPHPIEMHNALTSHLEQIHAEALSFALTKMMPRPEAQAMTKTLCLEAASKRVPLGDLARAAYPDLPDYLFDPAAQMGMAPQAALDFAARAKAL